MNFLAHLNLAYPSEQLLAGNYICDFITKHQEKEIHQSFQAGIKMHRWIDHFSNNHTEIRQINKFFHAQIHKYAPVGTDIVCDYLLYRNWDLHNLKSFDTFQDDCYNKLNRMVAFMPIRIGTICSMMIQDNWLLQYTNLTRLENVCKRLNIKAKFPVDFRSILPILEKHEAQLTECFNRFYMDCKNETSERFNPQSEMTK
ncbi:MAG: ACP phosphodiesterase [Saprospiraceae bacterium]|jgi:acyl carrier protein phosphodiesterase